MLRRRSVPAAAVLAFALAGCGDDDPATPPPAPVTTAQARPAGDSRDLRAFIRRRGHEDGAAWTGAIDSRATVLRRGGDEAAVTVNGAPTETDLEEVCAAAKDYRSGPAIVKVSASDGSLVTEC